MTMFWSFFQGRNSLQYQYKHMSKKRAVQQSKDRSFEHRQQTPKKMDELPDQKIRILQDNLVFVNGLPPDASSRDLLMDDLHFYRYGNVDKLILNPPYANKKGVTYQAYVTYGNHLDSSLAIVALDGYKLSERPLKVSFGTTKYCSHFIRGNSCPNPDCFYLHQLDKERQVSSGDTRTIFKEQNAKAVSYILQHLEQVAAKVLDSDVQDIEEGLPSITQTLDYMIDNEELLQSDLDKAFAKAKAKRETALEVPSEAVRIQSVAVEHREKEREKEKEHPKLVKSNSHSTMCTPTKPDDLVLAAKKKQQSKIVETKPQQKQKQRQKQKEKEVNSRQKQGTNKENSAVGTRQLKLEQKIQKLIIKEIWKKGNSQCRSRFVKGVTASREECSKLKGIVQKFLIAQN